MKNAIRRILLAVTGLSPQVVTETLYALAVGQNPPWVPDEIHLITSREGAERARLALLDPVAGQFHAFCREHGVGADIRFTAETIHAIRDADGEPLTDIRTPADNALAADAIHAIVRRFTADPETELHVSIAGGRKTMGFYLGYCLSLAARPQDRLSHVLVSEPFESLPDFYFPPATPRLLHARDGRPVHTADARVMLAKIPFVRLRPLLPAAALAPDLSFGDAVAATQAHLEQPRLRVDPGRREIRCGATALRLPPQLFAWYAWFARRCRDGLPPVRHTDADPAGFLDLYAGLVGIDAVDYENTVEMVRKGEGFSKEFFEQKCAKANRALKKALGLAADPYLIRAEGRRPLTRYRLRLAAAAVECL
jgi:CRISPR-associated protein (TIGR02584 family)